MTENQTINLPAYLSNMIEQWSGCAPSRQCQVYQDLKGVDDQQDDVVDDQGFQYKKSIKYGSEEARQLSREYVIEECCKQHVQEDSPILQDAALCEVLQSIMPQVVKASLEMKLQADNPVKLLAYIFMIKTSLSSKRVLQMLKLPLGKTGNQFSVISKGRQIYQRYMARNNIIIPDDSRMLVASGSSAGQKQGWLKDKAQMAESGSFGTIPRGDQPLATYGYTGLKLAVQAAPNPTSIREQQSAAVSSALDELLMFHRQTGLLQGQTKDMLYNIAIVCAGQGQPKTKRVKELLLQIVKQQDYLFKQYPIMAQFRSEMRDLNQWQEPIKCNPQYPSFAQSV